MYIGQYLKIKEMEMGRKILSNIIRGVLKTDFVIFTQFRYKSEHMLV